MTRVFVVFLALLMVLGSCTQRMICPAYQSAFIYDKDELRKKFSYFLEDSTPKVYAASKNRYLVAEPVSYQQKIRSMRTIRMKTVPVSVPDSLTNKNKEDSVSMADFDRAARSIIDSTFIADVPTRDSVAEELDSIYVITKDREVRVLKYNAPDSLVYDPVTERYIPQTPNYYIEEVRYNMEQDNYMWYMRDVIMLPDVRLAQMQQAEGGGQPDKEKQGLKGFFKNLFKKKPKEETDSTALRAPVEEEEFDYIDAADTVSQAEIPQPGQAEKPKKGFFKGLFGKKNKPADKRSGRKDKTPPQEVAPPPVDPANKKKEEDEDDGF